MSFFGSLKAAAAGALFGFRMAFGGFGDAANFSPDRGQFFHILSPDTRYATDGYTRRRILQRVTWLFQNFGVIKEACRGMARHVVGKGICLSLNTDDDDWNALAEADFEAWASAPDRCDLAGRRNFYEQQNFAVFQRMKQGEFIAAFVKNPRWDDAPCVQIFDSLELDSPGGVADPNIVDGVQLDAHHCPQFHWFQGLDGKFTPYPSSEVVHWYFADEANQVRGISEFAQAVRPMIDTRGHRQAAPAVASRPGSASTHAWSNRHRGPGGAPGAMGGG